jgi:coiled-coil and C2 domain-containing protein 2A
MVHKISELFLPVPEDHEAFETAARTSYDFCSDKLRINGEIRFRVGWSAMDVETSSDSVVPPRKSNIQLSQTLLDKWHADGTLNPLDPESQHLVNVVRRAQQSQATDDEKSNSTSYRFNEDRLAFCSADELNNNERFNLLIARFSKDLKYKSLKFVPQMEREIEVDDAMQIVDATIGLDQIDLQRHRGKRYLKSVYATLTNYCENLESESRNANILMGDDLLSLG